MLILPTVKNRWKTTLLATLPFLLLSVATQARDREEDMILKRMFSYAATIDTTNISDTTCTYVKFNIHVGRRNAILMVIPTMYAIARGKDRYHFGETFDQTALNGWRGLSSNRLLEQTTIPHGRKTMPNLLKYLTPDLYGVTLIDNYILSPFNAHNRKFYSYHVSSLYGKTVVSFKPKLDNTQLIRGKAVVDAANGRVLTTDFQGEYDMIRFSIDIEMGTEGYRTLIPKSCALDSEFKFLGNRISTSYLALYDLPDEELEGEEKNDTSAMARVRPLPLTAKESRMLDLQRKRRENTDSAKGSAREKKVWDIFADHLVNRIRSNFGNSNQGYVRINPILNPLYFGYSGRRGLTYKFDAKGSYSFTSNSSIAVRFKAGYAFKQHRFYFNLPIQYYYDRKNNGYVELEVGNGNRISSSALLDIVKQQHSDTINWDEHDISYFKDTKIKFITHRDFGPHWGLEMGFISHHRTASHKNALLEAGLPISYRSVAPLVELQYRPMGYEGPIVTADYERSIKGFGKANMEYERWEFDGQYRHRMSSMQTLLTRLGCGFYTHKGSGWYFLDYTNFRENNIPGGWDDDWACEFELLDRNWYNASEYYVRGNITYESPLLLTSWLPLVGHFIEKERLYVNALTVRHLRPYMEYGYGFSTRFFSMGLFLAQRNGHIDGFGCKFGFELFRHW